MGMNNIIHSGGTPEFIPAASVIIVNDQNEHHQVLLVHRSPELNFHPDLWAFPGGHIDAVDRIEDDKLETARQCAIRETLEETGLDIKAGSLIYMARWITPSKLVRRFDTWFFMAVGDYRNVRVDGREIIGHTWRTPKQAVLDHHRNIRHLTPPAFVFLTRLAEAEPVGTLSIQPTLSNQVPYFRGRVVNLPNGRCTLYEEDEAYCHADLERPGHRHRLWMLESGWNYEYPL